MATPTRIRFELLPIRESDVAVRKAKELVQEYDFIRFTFADLNGVPRGCLVPGDVAHKLLPDGVNCYSGLVGIGSKNDLVSYKEVVSNHYGNVLLTPDLGTLHPVCWVGDGKYSTGQLIGESHWDPTRPQEACPRSIARRMLAKLDDLGLKFFSGVEIEYLLMDKKTKTPVFDGCDYWSWLIQAEFDSWFCEVQKNMKKAGVSVEMMHTEYSHGQFEFAIEPEFGIKGADASFLCKQITKEMAWLQGFEANFMARRFPDEMGSGAHFNFSLWKKDSDDVNMLWDANGKDKLSEFGWHWIGGMIKHAKAMTALCCITTNCYKRLHNAWTPTCANWGIGDRLAMLRVKNNGPKRTYIENRIPSGLSNPYLVMAAIIAAGIDGIENQIPCPDQDALREPESLPKSLEEALQALQEDDVIVDAVGKTFVEWFIKLKTETDLKDMEDVSDEAAQFEKQVERYSKLS